MKLIKRMGQRLGLALLVLAVSASLALAQSYGLTHTGSSGGGGSLQTADGNFTLSGSLARADAGPVMSDGGSYTLNGGFWPSWGNVPASAPSEKNVYLPVIIHNSP